MDLNIFKPNDEDGAFLAYIKREASFHIEHFSEDSSKEHWYEYYKALMELVISSKNSHTKNPYEFISCIIESKDYLKYQIPLLPVNIIKEDFEIVNSQILWNHKRSLDLIWNSVHDLNDKNSIYYRNAYNLQIRKTFDFINKEVTDTNYSDSQYIIFISKGGIINGDFIDITYIHTKDYEKGYLKLNLPIIIPVCEVYFKDKNDTKSLIYVVDHREPNLKLLMEKYNCPICNNIDIASYKLNLRNCKKIEHSKKDFNVITFNKPEINKKGNYNVVEENDAVYLNCQIGTIAKWKNGHLTIYYGKIKYKKVNPIYWNWFTGYNLSYLKNIYNRGNNNITFVY